LHRLVQRAATDCVTKSGLCVLVFLCSCVLEFYVEFYLLTYHSACVKKLFHTVMLYASLNGKLHANLVSISQKTYCVTVTKTNLLLMFTEIMTVHSQTYMRQEIHRVHKTKLRVQVTGLSVCL